MIYLCVCKLALNKKSFKTTKEESEAVIRWTENTMAK
jgi:hypothetical protein